MNQIDQAVQLLKQGQLVAFPTETVYGLGADATNPNAINLIYQTKGRPSTNPLIIHVASEQIAQRYVTTWPLAASRLAQAFWPGPLTIVLPKNPIIPHNATANLHTVALRIPNHPLALELLRAFDGALAAPSANRFTHVSPTTAQHVRDEFPSPQPAMILDGGPCSVGIESTVLDLTTPQPTVLRPGQITPADLLPIIGPVQSLQTITPTSTPSTSPGQHETHYAPRTPAFRFNTSQRPLLPSHPIGLLLLSPEPNLGQWEHIVAMPNDPAQYAQQLYAMLRKLDAMNLPALYIELPPNDPAWSAIRDRLTRATRPIPKT